MIYQKYNIAVISYNYLSQCVEPPLTGGEPQLSAGAPQQPGQADGLHHQVRH